MEKDYIGISFAEYIKTLQDILEQHPDIAGHLVVTAMDADGHEFIKRECVGYSLGKFIDYGYNGHFSNNGLFDTDIKAICLWP
jgi:hypothetical protein